MKLIKWPKYERYTISELPVDGLKKLTEPPVPGLSLNTESEDFNGRPDAVAAALKRLQTKVPLRPYDWGESRLTSARTTKLREYQNRGCGWLVGRLVEWGGALLADDMGLGKTLQSITTARSIVPSAERVLIVAPAAARETWKEELAKWAPGESVYLMEPGRKGKDAQTARWVVSSYDLVQNGACEEECFPYAQPYMVILDEIHRVKSRKAQRSKALVAVCANARYKLGLTGTPIWDRPRDLWMLLHILLGGAFGNQWAFDEAYCGGKPGEHGWVNDGATNPEELRDRLRWYMLRREKQEVATELPALTRVVRWVDGTSKAKAALERLELGLSNRAMHAALLATLEDKLDEAVNLAAESRRFVLATWLREHATLMCKRLNEQGVPTLLITGDISTKERQARVVKARGGGHGIVATTDSISEAINMQGVASQGIVHALDWVGPKVAQLEARIHRIGQVDPVQWTYLAMRDSADQLVIRAVVNKLQAFNAVVGSAGADGLSAALNANENGAMSDQGDMMRELAAMLSGGDTDD